MTAAAPAGPALFKLMKEKFPGILIREGHSFQKFS